MGCSNAAPRRKIKRLPRAELITVYVVAGVQGSAVAGAGALGGCDLGCGKNEAIFGGIVGFSFVLAHFHDVQEVAQIALLLDRM
jgi:hypothetical protein